MNLRICIGYFIFTGLVWSACIIGAPVNIFLDIPTAILLFGGTGVLLLPLLKGISVKNITWLGMPSTIISAVTGMTVIMIGIIILLGRLNDPSSIGPSLAICILGIFYTLMFMSLISIPLEDWHNLKHKTYNEVTLSRITWFLFPIFSSFLITIVFAILVQTMTLTLPKQSKSSVEEQNRIDYFIPIEK